MSVDEAGRIDDTWWVLWRAKPERSTSSGPGCRLGPPPNLADQ
jgi:hypothetical protein